MDNFTYYNPTRIVFGKGSIAEIGRLIPPGEKILLTYGGGSIKRTGTYQQVMEALEERQVVEFGGIPPNPTFEVLMDAVALARREEVTFLLAVGGGSVIDGTKFIAAAVPFRGDDPWIIAQGKAELENVLPLGAVLTIPATNSESNSTSVISRRATQEKVAAAYDACYPRFAILDPEVTYSVPRDQIRNGIVDSFVHVTEQYLTYPVNAPLQDRQAEAVLRTLIEEGPKTLENPTDYDARANFMWCASQSLNGLLRCGVPTDFTTHRIGHELTAFYGLDHAPSLAGVLIALMKENKAEKAGKILQYAERVWGIPTGKGDAAVDQAIERTEAFFNSLGMPTHLHEFGIDAEDAARRVCARFEQRGTVLGERRSVTPQKAAAILRRAA